MRLKSLRLPAAFVPFESRVSKKERICQHSQKWSRCDWGDINKGEFLRNLKSFATGSSETLLAMMIPKSCDVFYLRNN